MNEAMTPSHGPGRKVRVHLENQSGMPEMFHLTAQRWSEALSEFPTLQERIDVSIGWDGDGFDSAMADCEVLVGWNIPRRQLAQKAPRLRLVHLTGAGLDHLVPLDWMPPDLIITNSSGIHAERAGEYVAMAAMALNARLPGYIDNKASRLWKPDFRAGVRGQTFLVIGVGGLGEAGAARCKALDMQVIGVRASGLHSASVHSMVKPAMLMQVLPQADIVLLTMPLTDATRGMIGREQLLAMKPGAGLINMARGAVLDHAALREVLESGHLSGAFLDVADVEPPPADDPIWSLPRTIITPHISCDDPARYIQDALRVLLGNLERADEGRPLLNVVDAARGY